MSIDERICTVGYALNAKKLRQSGHTGINQQWKGGGLSDIVYQASHDHVEGVKFSPWNNTLSIEKQPEYDVLIHKLTEDILTDPYGKRIQDLKHYLHHHPNTVMIDSIEAVETVLSRSSTCNRLKQIQEDSSSTSTLFSIPNFIVLDSPSRSSDEIIKLLKDANMHLPVICKPIDACGTPTSHQLVVIVSISDFASVRYPCIVQQYWNHNAKLYKVYVIDRDVMVYERPSLPDLYGCHGLKSVAFDSSATYPTIQSFLSSSDMNKEIMMMSPSSTSSKLKEVIISNELFHDTAMKIADGFNLSLFGFDVIIPNQPSASSLDQDQVEHDCLSDKMISAPPRLMVIDVNYFPSFKEVEDFPQRLRLFIRRRAGYGQYSITTL